MLPSLFASFTQEAETRETASLGETLPGNRLTSTSCGEANQKRTVQHHNLLRLYRQGEEHNTRGGTEGHYCQCTQVIPKTEQVFRLLKVKMANQDSLICHSGVNKTSYSE